MHHALELPEALSGRIDGHGGYMSGVGEVVREVGVYATFIGSSHRCCCVVDAGWGSLV